ncbi:MAG: outer membrane beta-barrel protein [Acidiferrobacter sp.]
MSIPKNIKRIVATTALLALPLTAVAATPWYVGATAGLGNMSGYSHPLDFTVFGGYNLPVHLGRGTLAVEAGYDHLGTFNENGLPAGESASLRMHALEASAVYSWPIARAFSVYGRAGLAAWYASATASVTSGGVTYTGSSSGNGVDPLLGVGVAYAVMPNLAIRGEFRTITSTSGGSIDLFDAGAVFSF